MRPFHIYLVVWGSEWINKLTKYLVPCLLAPQNLPEVVKHRPCRMIISTTPEDKRLFESTTAFKLLTDVIPIQFELCPTVIDKYWRVAAAQKYICRFGKEETAFGVFVTPDMLMSNGTLYRFHELVDTGSKAIMMIGPRVIDEEVAPLLNQPVLLLTGRELFRFVCDHLHNETETFQIVDNSIYYDPGYMIWLHNKNIWIIHPIYALPIVVDMSDANLLEIGYAIEVSNFIPTSIRDRNTITFITDSDNAMIAATCGRDTIHQKRNAQFNSDFVKSRMFRNTVNDYHRYYFTKTIIFHDEDLPTTLPERCKEINEFVRNSCLI